MVEKVRPLISIRRFRNGVGHRPQPGPSPAASTIAVRGDAIMRRSAGRNAASGGRTTSAIGAKSRMSQDPARAAARPAAGGRGSAAFRRARHKPRENAEDLAIALRRQNGSRAQKRRAVERRKSGKIALDHRAAQLGSDIAPGVFEERYEIVARRTRTPRPGNRGARSPAPRSDPATASGCRRGNRAAPGCFRRTLLAAGAVRHKSRYSSRRVADSGTPKAAGAYQSTKSAVSARSRGGS